MKLSWIFTLLLLIFVALFSVQNAASIDVRFLAWDLSMSAALAIQLAALLGGLVGFACGLRSRPASVPDAPLSKPPAEIVSPMPAPGSSPESP